MIDIATEATAPTLSLHLGDFTSPSRFRVRRSTPSPGATLAAWATGALVTTVAVAAGYHVSHGTSYALSQSAVGGYQADTASASPLSTPLTFGTDSSMILAMQSEPRHDDPNRNHDARSVIRSLSRDTADERADPVADVLTAVRASLGNSPLSRSYVGDVLTALPPQHYGVFLAAAARLSIDEAAVDVTQFVVQLMSSGSEQIRRGALEAVTSLSSPEFAPFVSASATSETVGYLRAAKLAAARDLISLGQIGLLSP